MTFDEWMALSESEQDQLHRTWKVYEVGYWHDLRKEAERRFREKYAHHPLVVEVHGGTYHGGVLIIGVSLSSDRGNKAGDIPKKFAGFHVQQFWLTK